MIGKLLAGFIVVTALLAGVAMYYLQVYAYYDEVAASGTNDVQMTSLVSGLPEPILYDGFKAIDSDSSPIRYRACFTTRMSQAMLTETYELYDGAVPLVAPGWFDCFDAKALGAELENGTALAFAGQRNIQYGVDRVVAVTADGRGYVWHQINHCGEVVFDGKPAPEDCPTPPEGY
ncbi:DUF6446 family protein [Thalassovita aquimarina]|uniref:Histidine kinase n=1 Tax=Thalassovita aquimarina TaxID=2785917 RepID=A0ABS5HWC6_9RHOB|nr:DUF6446 family protein [Thalassovita aquimarina]MBR9652828.1 histidine kinase [Thalassovita aquimarina]